MYLRYGTYRTRYTSPGWIRYRFRSGRCPSGCRRSRRCRPCRWRPPGWCTFPKTVDMFPPCGRHPAWDTSRDWTRYRCRSDTCRSGCRSCRRCRPSRSPPPGCCTLPTRGRTSRRCGRRPKQYMSLDWRRYRSRLGTCPSVCRHSRHCTTSHSRPPGWCTFPSTVGTSPRCDMHPKPYMSPGWTRRRRRSGRCPTAYRRRRRCRPGRWGHSPGRTFPFRDRTSWRPGTGPPAGRSPGWSRYTLRSGRCPAEYRRSRRCNSPRWAPPGCCTLPSTDCMSRLYGTRRKPYMSPGSSPRRLRSGRNPSGYRRCRRSRPCRSAVKLCQDPGNSSPSHRHTSLAGRTVRSGGGKRFPGRLRRCLDRCRWCRCTSLPRRRYRTIDDRWCRLGWGRYPDRCCWFRCRNRPGRT
jgi:hypothetical protein